MQKLLQLAEKIEDAELRKKVVEILQNPELANPFFKKYKKADLKKVKAKFTTSFGIAERDVYNHTIALAELCLQAAQTIEKNYPAKINQDHLLAGALLHDLMKVFEWKEDGEHSGLLLDHSTLAAAELYRRNFPEEVIHLVTSHAGEHSSNPPRTLEAFLLHYLDTLLAMVEVNLFSKEKVKVLVSEDLLKFFV